MKTRDETVEVNVTFWLAGDDNCVEVLDRKRAMADFVAALDAMAERLGDNAPSTLQDLFGDDGWTDLTGM